MIYAPESSDIIYEKIPTHVQIKYVFSAKSERKTKYSQSAKYNPCQLFQVSREYPAHRYKVLITEWESFQ